jgi:general nucleoside transport system ATP-binding protein
VEDGLVRQRRGYSEVSASVALALSGIRKVFDGFVALDGAHFTAHHGEVHALLGENGAGKSSLMNIAAGLYAPEAGSLFIEDNPANLRGPKDAAALGVGMVHQHFKLVRPFTVVENLLLNENSKSGGRFQERKQRMALAVQQRAASLGFAIDVERRVDQLSIAEQQRVEILKVLMGGARILILDEPTAVLTDAESESLLDTVRQLAKQGACVVLVTHKMQDVKRFADRVTVMRAGRTVATRQVESTSTTELVELTVGQSPAPPARPSQQPAEVVFRAHGLSRAARGASQPLQQVELAVRSGEVFGIAGVGGNGQSELVETLLGLELPASGTMEVRGQTLRAGDVAQRHALGIAVIPSDRQRLALAQSLGVSDNVALAQVALGRLGSWWRLDRTRLRTQADQAVKAFDVQGVRSLEQKAALLSGGNAQKLVLAREFGKQPSVVIAHSPSRGLDVRASAQVHQRLLDAAAQGAAVLLISEDLDEVMGLAHRIGVMNRGRLVAQFDHPFDRQALGQAMVDHV